MNKELVAIKVTVNGVLHQRLVAASMTLVDFLREELKLKGTKKGCDNGQCGACTVMMDDQIVYSCHVLAVQADGRRITTIEGVARGEELHPIQQALIDQGAIQCGFCTPGLVLAIKALLDEYPQPDDGQIRYALGGNICRCTGYVKIERAVRQAAGMLKGA